MLNSSAILGLAVGSFSAGSAISIGRRKAALYAQTIAIVAAVITLV